ncbi:MAG: DUF255 domain-containing protein [Bacteroidota bacterium]
MASSVIIAQEDGVKWYSWQEGMAKAEREDKKFVIDLYTDWCGWCKKMDSDTFDDPNIAKYINERYIPIKLNAEIREEILFQGETHRYIKSGKRGYNTLAAKITNGRLSYPTVVFLDENKQLIQAIAGYQKAAQFEPILHYFADDMHQKMAWTTFLRSFNTQTPPTKPNHGVLVGQKGN